MKKIVALLLALTLVGSLFVGCTKKSDEKEVATEKTDQAKAKDESKKEEKKEEPVKIGWLAYNPGMEQPDQDAPFVKEMEEKFNVDFDIWYVSPKNYDELLNVKLAANRMPDVFKLNKTDLSVYAEQGVLGEVSVDTIKEYAPDLYAMVEKYTDGDGWKIMQYKGVNYGVPKISVGKKYPHVVVWRKDWLDKVGIMKVPETLDEFEEALTRFTFDDPDGNGKDDTYGMADWAMEVVFGAYGVGELNDFKWFGTNRTLRDGMPTFACIQPETKLALAKLREWYEKGIIDPEFVTSEHTSGSWHVSQGFLNGRIGLSSRLSYAKYPNPELDPNNDKYKMLKASDPNYELAFGVPAIGPEGKSGTAASAVYGGGFVFTKEAVKDPQKVQKILEIWNETYKDVNFAIRAGKGEEGVHYNYVNDVVRTTKEFEGVEIKKFGYEVFSIPSPEADMITNKKEFEWADKVASIPKYVSPKVPPTEAYGKYSADLKRMAAEAFIKIITGKEPIDYFDTFVKDYLANGGQETIDAMQEAWGK